MTENDTPYTEPLIDEVRATRERLVREHGGLRGWCEYLRKLEQQHPERLISPEEFRERRRGRPAPSRDGS